METSRMTTEGRTNALALTFKKAVALWKDLPESKDSDRVVWARRILSTSARLAPLLLLGGTGKNGEFFAVVDMVQRRLVDEEEVSTGRTLNRVWSFALPGSGPVPAHMKKPAAPAKKKK